MRDPLGLFYTFWRGDPLPDLADVPSLSIESVDNQDADVVGIDLGAAEIRSRVEWGHRLYVAHISGDVVAWGWSASSTAGIGEFGIRMELPPATRYLWDFMTLPEWRGQGIYPQLLQAVLDRERDVQWFWIGHDYANAASGRGILRAGFHLVGDLCDDESGCYLVAADRRERALLAAELLGVPVRDQHY